MNSLKIAIGIQARKSSTRLPEKSVKVLTGSTTLIDSLVDNCLFCSNHVSKKNQFYKLTTDIFVLVPDEEIDFWKNFFRCKRVTVLGGSADDVLSRYMHLSTYDYIVRLTADCPNVPALTINKSIFTCIHHELDYLANSWENYRTAVDGHDTEILSNKALHWLDENATKPEQREHVTLAIRQAMPPQLKLGLLHGKEDLSHIKLCVDTPDEYFSCERRFVQADKKRKEAISKRISVFEY